MQAPSYHTPVLVEEALSYLITSKRGIYADATLGGGGHAEAILRQLEQSGKLIGFDADEDAVVFATNRLAAFQDRLIIRKSNFKEFKKIISECVVGGVDGVLFDLGVSSYQLDEPTKGFSFRFDGPLDMRMDRKQELNARQVVNEYE